MAFVLLPCDLPTWPTITRLLTSLGGANSPGQVGHVLRALHALTDVSLDPDPSEGSAEGVEAVAAGVEDFLRREGDALEVWEVALPSLVSAALALKDLKPPHGLTYSLQQQGGDVVVARRLAASLLAHMFLGTLPRRGPLTHPTLTDPSLAPILAALHRESQKTRLRAFFRYFKMLAREKCGGEVAFSRKVMTGREWVRLQKWAASETPLCSVEVRREGGVTSGHPQPALITAFTTPDTARPALTPTASQAAAVLQASPEVVVAAVLVERLEDNEALQVTGALTPAPPGQAGSWRGLTHVLMDADDYRASEVLQYEEVNVLRELNKARLGFSQDLPPPVLAPVKSPFPASSSSRSSDIISVSRQESGGSGSTGQRFKDQDAHLTTEDGRQGKQTGDATKEIIGKDEKETAEERTTGEGEKEAKKEEVETKTEKKEEVETKTEKKEEVETKTAKKESVKGSKQTTEENGTKERVTQPDKETRGGSERYYDTTEPEWRSEPPIVPRKTSIKQKIKGMLRKSDAKAKDKAADKSEASSSKRGLSFKYYRRGKGKGKAKGKEGSVVDSKADTEDESAVKGKQADSAGKQGQQKSADRSEKQARQQHQETPGSQKGSAASAAQQQQRSAGRDTQSAPPTRTPGIADGRKSAPESSTPAGEKSPAAALQQQESAGSSYVTAHTTLRPSSRKPRLTRTKRLEVFPSSCDPGSPRSPPPGHGDVRVLHDTSRGSRGTGESLKGGAEEEEDEDEDETTRLLNRVLRAIKILEKERPELVEEAKEEEEKEREVEKEVAQRSPDQPRTLGRMKVRRPPTPRPLRHEPRGRGVGGIRLEEGDWKRRLGKEERIGAGGGEVGELGERRKKVLGNEGVKNLSQYHSCSEDLPPTPSSPPTHKPPTPPHKPLSLPQGRPTVSPLGPSHPRSPPLSPLNRSHPRTPPVSPLNASHARSPPLSPLNRSQPRSPPLSPPLSPLSLRCPQVSEDDPYYSACESLDDEEAVVSQRPRRPSRKRGKKSARKSSFAERLKEAIAREPSPDDLPDVPRRLRVNRQESAGFVLDHNLPQSFSKEEQQQQQQQEEEEEEEEEGESSEDEDEDEEEEGGKREKTCSSHYSFSSDYTSELDEVYEELGAALEGLEGGEPQGPRVAALTRLARSILKRGLSESFKDMPLGLDGSTMRSGPQAGGEPLLPRSLSLTGHHSQHARATKTLSHGSKARRGKPVVTGNWGCGSLKGDPQLKAMIQWAAASQAGAPHLIYCTYGDPQLVKLDTVARLVGDRGWTVGQLVTTVLRYCEVRLRQGPGAATLEIEHTESADSTLPEAYRYRSRQENVTLFDDLIGRERPHGGLKTEL